MPFIGGTLHESFGGNVNAHKEKDIERKVITI